VGSIRHSDGTYGKLARKKTSKKGGEYRNKKTGALLNKLRGIEERSRPGGMGSSFSASFELLKGRVEIRTLSVGEDAGLEKERAAVLWKGSLRNYSWFVRENRGRRRGTKQVGLQ